jgi:hypothetical protein
MAVVMVAIALVVVVVIAIARVYFDASRPNLDIL